VGKRVYILGAGASHAYDRSIFGVRPPLARGFFNAYHNLPISDQFDVKVGNIVNFVRDVHGIPPHEFSNYVEDVEAFLVRVDGMVQDLVTKAKRSENLTDDETMCLFQAQRAKFELLLLFSRVLIDTTEGPPCPYHGMLAANLSAGDVILDFNWDTLCDRALFATGEWRPDTGYGLAFEAIMDGEWRLPDNKAPSSWQLLKLHGSVNWLICYPGLDPRDGKEISHLPPDRYHDKFCYVRLEGEPDFGCRSVLFNPLVPPQRDDGHKSIVGNVIIDPKTIKYAWDVRVYGDYTPYAKMASLIIPPSHKKRYDLPGQVFGQLWPRALKSLVESDEVYLCGYSLPVTDKRPRQLLRDVCKARDKPLRIGLVSPHSEELGTNLRRLLGKKNVDVWQAADSFETFVAPHSSELILPGAAWV